MTGPQLFKRSVFLPVILAALSAVLLILAFPKYDLWGLAWIGLVPLFFALDALTTDRSFRLGFFWGGVFFSGTLNWFIHMSRTSGIPVFLSLLALVALVSYLSLFFAVFFVVYSRTRQWPLGLRLVFLPGVWAALEFLRDWLFSGFGWCALGYSQYTNLPAIQIADVTGVFGVSFVIVLVNLLLKETLDAAAGKRPWSGLVRPAAAGFLVVGTVFVYGWARLAAPHSPAPGDSVNIAVVQGNVDQEVKWDPWAWPEIMEKYLALTEQAARKHPDLIIWPETAFPGYVWDAPQRYDRLRRYVKDLGIPLLFGMVTKEGDEYFNSAVLLSREGRETLRYAKSHLVPFGEYLPLRKQLPFLGMIVPIEDFTAGKGPVLFPVRSGAGRFAVSICFEDTVPRVVRRSVRAGAGFLVNITNDAWFLDTKEPYLHLQGAVFRAVENRRYLVRAANTGVSCFLDPFGRVTARVQDRRGDATYVDGIAAARVAFRDDLSFYTKYGDVFTYLCFGCILGTAFVRKFRGPAGNRRTRA